MRVLIIGAGRVGSTLAELLSSAGHSVTVIDKSEEKVLNIQADVESYIRDATDPSVYEELDIRIYDVVVAATDRDEVNLFVAAIAKLNNIEKVYVRVKNPKTSRLLRILGVEGIIVVPQIAANILYTMIEGRYKVVNLVNTLIGEFKLVSLTVRETSSVRGITPLELEKRGLLPKGVKILAIYWEDRFYDPSEAPPLEPGQIVVALAHEESIKELSELF
ncbi:MAG: TrkA family potassium uptake protein [Desulfurococcales archaeon]|nr:TrkA family potassium uptake protein [Desulfurococcales archaeon]